ncbi:MAG: tetratricopeptide repeat protein [Planctomycetota bacterium]
MAQQQQQQQQQQALVPTRVELKQRMANFIDSDFLSEDERRELRIFHGVWRRDQDLNTPRRTAETDLLLYRFDREANSLDHPEVPIAWRAEALVRAGENEQAARLLIAAIEGDTDPEQDGNTPVQADDDTAADHPAEVLPTVADLVNAPFEVRGGVAGRRILAEALDWLGLFNAADEVIDPVIRSYERGELSSADDLTDAARCLIHRARLRGEPARRYQEILSVLGRVHQQIDRNYWPARLVEAQLLLDKDNAGQAAMALHEVLSLNPRASEAWYLLGRIANERFDFDSALRAVERLRQLHPEHPLAITLETEVNLMQSMPEAAEFVLTPLLEQFPRHRHGFALRATVNAVMYDFDGMLNVLDELDEISPGHPYGYYITGLMLSLNRQYEIAAEVLEEAIDRQPNWPAPHVELGLLELQSGRDDRALAALERVMELDPFNERAVFSHHLIQSLQEYDTVESEHFIVRFDPETADPILAREMLPSLEEMYADMRTIFDHELDRKTLIELLPNHERFAVRIAGIPAIRTIAACTGPVIAMESPRDGRGHSGTYDWLRVLRHEFVHTMTLSMSQNRIPHWYTEAFSVWQEQAPREYHTAQMLAHCLQNNLLFDLDAINWGFVRPKRSYDVSLAYAQAHWMLEFIRYEFGHDAAIELLHEYHAGMPEELAMPAVLEVSRVDFMRQFLSWAENEAASWGLAPEPSLETLIGSIDPAELPAADIPDAIARPEADPASELGVDAIVADPTKLPDAALDMLLDAHPEHPDLLELKVRRLQAGNGTTAELIPWLERYAEARPVDPMPHRLLAMLKLDAERWPEAIPHLEQLDRWNQRTGAYAIDLARRYRSLGDIEQANAKADRALMMEPFNAAYREFAAALAIEAGRLDDAQRHLIALTLIEPEQGRHLERLQALQQVRRSASRDGE